MKIVYFNYISHAIGPLIRTLELAKACSENNIQVSLYFMRRSFKPGDFILKRIEAYQSPNLSIHYLDLIIDIPKETIPDSSVQVNITPKAPRMTTLGLFKQALSSLRYIPAELKIISEEKPDVLLARPDEVFSFCFSSRISGKPLLLETDGPVEELDLFWGVSSRPFKLIDLWRAKSANAVLCISRVCVDLWKAKNIPDAKLFVIANGANPDEFAPQTEDSKQTLRSQYHLMGSRVIGYSGNQRVWHGLANLFEAVLPLLQTDKNLKLLIIGCGKNLKLLEDCQVPSNIVDQQIIFTGHLSYLDMAKHIDLADVMVMPYEILPLFYFSPMRMFEAMSLGKTLITSKQGQMEDFLDDRSSVLFFDPNRKNDLREKINTVLNNAELISSGIRNRDYLLASHTWNQRGREISQAIDYVLNN